MTQQAERDPGPAVSEPVRIHANVAGHLIRAGVDPALADSAADDVDWREVVSLIDAGCDPAVAIDIRRRT